ncbi:MAG: DUF5606 family protein [Flavitalea sp.]
MEYGKIIAITGMPGLFELMSSKNDGAIVRSLDDKSSKFVSSRVHNFSHLESIEVFTTGENVNLSEVFQAMEKSDAKIPDGKDAKEVKAYFEKVYGDLDFGRVYNSDMKKMVKWYNSLKENDVEIKLRSYEEDEPVEELAVEESNTEIAEEEKPKKTAKKKEAAEPAADDASEEKPKKAAKKKKTTEE